MSAQFTDATKSQERKLYARINPAECGEIIEENFATSLRGGIANNRIVPKLGLKEKNGSKSWDTPTSLIKSLRDLISRPFGQILLYSLWAGKIWDYQRAALLKHLSFAGFKRTVFVPFQSTKTIPFCQR